MTDHDDKAALVERAETQPTLDDAKLEEAVEFIRENVAEQGRNLVKLGAYLVETFYDGDQEAYRARGTTKATTLKTLSERCNQEGIPISASHLGNAIQLHLEVSKLPESSPFHKLPFTHRLEIMRGSDLVDQREQWAQTALDEKLSVKKLKELIGQNTAVVKTPSDSEPRFVVGLSEVRESFRSILRADRAKLTDKQRDTAAQQVRDLIEELKDLFSVLTADQQQPKVGQQRPVPNKLARVGKTRQPPLRGKVEVKHAPTPQKVAAAKKSKRLDISTKSAPKKTKPRNR